MKSLKKNFHRLTIYNLSNKLKDDEFGKINEDAKMFIQVLEEDHKKGRDFIKPNLMTRHWRVVVI